jgi:hypothetical protein
MRAWVGKFSGEGEMDEIDGEGRFSDGFKAFRKAVHLESPLEFAVFLIVLACLLGGVGIFLRTPGNWFLVKHGMWGQLFGVVPRRGPAAVGGAGADQAGTPASSNQAQADGGSQTTPTRVVPAAPGIVRITKQKLLSSTNSALPNGLEIELVPDRTMGPVAMTLKFSGEVGEIHSNAESADVLDAQFGILLNSPDTVIMEWSSPPFGPFSPLLMTVFSKDKIKLDKVVTVPYRFPYDGADLK